MLSFAGVAEVIATYRQTKVRCWQLGVQIQHANERS